MGSKFRISLTEQGDEIKGKVELDGPLSFALEALAATIETFGVDPVEFAKDLYLLVKKDMQK